MRSHIYIAVLLSVLQFVVLAMPIAERPKTVVDDVAILNYALTLEHLESAFYSGALAAFDKHAFVAAGYTVEDRERFVGIARHEAEHVAFLELTLGGEATMPCEYDFPYTDVRSFVALSQALEGVGVSGYLGAVSHLSSENSLIAAASVLSTEARHSAWVTSVLGGHATSGRALDTPLELNQILTIASSMIFSCPSTNPSIPAQAFPSLVFEGHIAAGSSVGLRYKSSDPRAAGQTYVAFFYGLSTTYAPLENGAVVIPAELATEGQVYAVVTSEKGRADDSTILAGPAILALPRYTKLA